MKRKQFRMAVTEENISYINKARLKYNEDTHLKCELKDHYNFVINEHILKPNGIDNPIVGYISLGNMIDEELPTVNLGKISFEEFKNMFPL